MTKITLNNVGDLSSTTTAQATINSNFNTIQTALDNTFSRDGTAPNTMEHSIDMDSNRILNLPLPASSHEPVRLLELEEAILGQGLDIPFHVTDTTQSTSTSTGSFISDGGMGIAKDLYIGGTLHVGSFTASPTELDFQGTTSGTTILKPQAVASGTISLPAATDTLVGKATVDTLTNKSISGSTNTITNVPISTAVSGLGTGVAAFLGVPSSSNLKTAITDETGSGSLVFANSPTLVTPTLGAATATTVNGNTLTPGTYTVTGGAGKTLTFNNSLAFTGSDGSTLTFPSGSDTVLTQGGGQTVSGGKNFQSGTLNLNGATSGATLLNAAAIAGSTTLTLPSATDTLVGKATTDTFTNKTFDTAGTGNSFSINSLAATANTGTGAVVRATSPTLVTPALGAATATSINGNTLTTGTYTLTGAASKTLTFNNSLTLAGTDGSTLTFPAGSDTVVTQGGANTISGGKTFLSGTLILNGATSGNTTINPAAIAGTTTVTLPGSTDTLVGKATTDTLTNKTIDTAGTNTIKVNGNTLAATAGSATLTLPNSTTTIVGRDTTDTLTNKTLTSPTLTTPSLGAATATTINGSTVSPGQYTGETSTGSASAGNIGEHVSSTVLFGSAIALTANTTANVTSISLTAGDWDINGSVLVTGAASTNYTSVTSSCSTTSATTDTTPGRQAVLQYGSTGIVFGSGNIITCNVIPTRISLSATTTVYLTVNAGFTVSTSSAWGLLRARRVR